jgi:hypothetical protein
VTILTNLSITTAILISKIINSKHKHASQKTTFLVATSVVKQGFVESGLKHGLKILKIGLYSQTLKVIIFYSLVCLKGSLILIFLANFTTIF